MRNGKSLILLALGALLLAAAPATAAVEPGDTDFEVYAGIYFPDGDVFDDDLTYGIRFGRAVSRHWGMEIDLGYYEDDQTIVATDWELEIFHVDVSAIAHVNPDSRGVFFITAGTFAGMSLWAYTTKKDLSGWGSFLFMGLIGIIIAMVVNIFLESSALQFAISVIGVLVFVGLTAYDTQAIKNEYAEHYDEETQGKLAISGALRLYLDFINLFIMLLHLFGNRE